MPSLLIWTYHRVLPEAGNAAVSLSLFEEQVKTLTEEGYHFIDTADLQNWLNGDLPAKHKFTMLSFDDGWADNLLYAMPILQKYSARAVLALNTGFVNPEKTIRQPSGYDIIDSKTALPNAIYNHDYSSFLTWLELEELNNSGLWDIQSHGHSHIGCYQDLHPIRGFYPDSNHWTMEYALGEKPFPGCPRTTFYSTLSHKRTILTQEFKNSLKQAQSNTERATLCRHAKNAIETLEKDNEFRERIKDDIMTCKTLLKEKLNINSTAFFWPWGQSSEVSRQVATECGHNLLFTMNKDAVTLSSSPTLIPRIAAPMTMKKFNKQLTIFSNPFYRGVRRLFSKK